MTITNRYIVKCDDCKEELRRTDSLVESAAGGRCPSCRPAVSASAETAAIAVIDAIRPTLDEIPTRSWTDYSERWHCTVKSRDFGRKARAAIDAGDEVEAGELARRAGHFAAYRLGAALDDEHPEIVVVRLFDGKTAEEIGESNAACAVDVLTDPSDTRSREEVVESYRLNAADTVLEYGGAYSPDVERATNAFDAELADLIDDARRYASPVWGDDERNLAELEREQDEWELDPGLEIGTVDATARDMIAMLGGGEVSEEAVAEMARATELDAGDLLAAVRRIGGAA